MVIIERTNVMNFKNTICGARNSTSSWNHIDSFYNEQGNFIMGLNDLDLAQRLARTSSDHRKFIRQTSVSVDFTAPLYWWKECDTYKVITVANSISTMHKVVSKPLTLDDFSHERMNTQAQEALAYTVSVLEDLRKDYLKTEGKETWYSMIQLLPSSYHQMRTRTLNYETLMNVYYAKRNHKLDE